MGLILISLSLIPVGVKYSGIIITVSLIVYSGILYGGVSQVKWQFFMPIVCRLPNRDNQIFLSFDDGPHENTEAILKLLKKYEAKGNFFCIGKHLDEHPLLVQKLVDEGHFVGNHSFSHTASFPIKSKNELMEEIQQTNSIIEKHTGKSCRFFRPPFGVTNPNINKAVNSLEMICIGWNIRSFDTMDREGNKAIHKIKKNLKSGDIILLHDYSPHILSILEELLLFLKDHKFTTERIDTIFENN